MYGDSTLGRTVHIVATEHLVDDSTLCVIVRCNSLVQINDHIASCRSSLTDRNLVGISCTIRISDIIDTTLTTSEHTAEVVILGGIIRINDLRSYSTSVDVHCCILCHRTNLTTAIDTAFHSTTGHVQCSALTFTEFCPQWKQCRVIQGVESSHTTCKHITTFGVLQMVLIVESGVWYRILLLFRWFIYVFGIVTNSTATDVDNNVSTTFIIVIGSFFGTGVRIRTVVLIVWT